MGRTEPTFSSFKFSRTSTTAGTFSSIQFFNSDCRPPSLWWTSPSSVWTGYRRFSPAEPPPQELDFCQSSGLAKMLLGCLCRPPLGKYGRLVPSKYSFPELIRNLATGLSVWTFPILKIDGSRCSSTLHRLVRNTFCRLVEGISLGQGTWVPVEREQLNCDCGEH